LWRRVMSLIGILSHQVNGAPTGAVRHWSRDRAGPQPDARNTLTFPIFLPQLIRGAAFTLPGEKAELRLQMLTPVNLGHG